MPESVEGTGAEPNALFARYPDIKFNPASDFFDGTHDKEHFSSPCSNNTDHEESLLSADSVSTANTTPLRPTPRTPDAGVVPTLANFMQHVERTDLPDVCKDWFKVLGRQMNDLARLLVPSDGRLEGYANSRREQVLDRSQPLLARLQDSNNRLEERVQNILHIRSLAPFTVEPAQQDVWSIYRQRANLVVNYTSPPSGTERKAFIYLTHLFDAYVYHPFLQLLDIYNVDLDIQNRINELYDAVMKNLYNYGQWWKGMKSIRHDYMLPLMRRIRGSQEILHGIKDFEKVKEAAKAVICNPEAPRMQLQRVVPSES